MGNRWLEDFDRLPRQGWVQGPTPITAEQNLARELDRAFVGVKRDDLLGVLHGGSKVRKLDYLLASAPFDQASGWHSVGAIGSGHLVTLTAAAQELERTLHAHCCWEPPTAAILENLAFTASGPTQLTFSSSRTRLALRRPSLLLASRYQGLPVIAPGASCPRGMLGMVRAGLELAEQVRDGELPEPARVYVAMGSGGTAIGLAVGMALGGLQSRVHAVAVVERIFASRWRLRWMRRQLLALVDELIPERQCSPGLPIVEHGFLGAGYGVPTARSVELSQEQRFGHGILLDAVYSGKAMHAMLELEKRPDRRDGRPLLFWATARSESLPSDERWRDKLPAKLARRLARSKPFELADGRRRIARRHVILGGATVLGLGITYRLSGYPEISWERSFLSPWQAHVLDAALLAVLPQIKATQRATAVKQIDVYLAQMSQAMRTDVDRMLGAIEHGTPMGCAVRRFTRLTAAQRVDYLDSLMARGGLLAQAARGIRDLCMLGYYQQATSWNEIGYGGPLISEPQTWPKYQRLRATPGQMPKWASP